MRVVGIDLAGKPENPSGFCLFAEERAETKLLYTDLEILKEIESVKPQCIAIDAPFFVITKEKVVPWRPCDSLLLKRGFHPLPLSLPSMQSLAKRAKHLVYVLRKRRYKLIEVFPRATEKILNLSKEPRKNRHEYDALLCALTAKAFLEKRYEDLEGIIIPR